MAAKLVQQFGLEVVFAGIFTGAQHTGAGLHGAYMGACADVAGPAHGVLLLRVFNQAHFVQHAAQVLLPAGAQRAVTHPITQALQSALHPRFQTAVRGKRVPGLVATVEQAGQTRLQFRQGIGLVHP